MSDAKKLADAELAAWDIYAAAAVSGILSRESGRGFHYAAEGSAQLADMLLEERRKRAGK